MEKKTYPNPMQEQDEAQERYFEHEGPKVPRRKIKKEDLDTLEHWDEP